MDSASDLIGTLSKTVGDQMIPFFDQLQKPLLRFMKPSRPFSDRAMAIGESLSSRTQSVSGLAGWPFFSPLIWIGWMQQ